MEISGVHQTHRLLYLIAGCLLAVCIGLLVSTSQAFATSGPVAINATNFPDANFLAVVDALDTTPKDGILDQAELDSFNSDSTPLSAIGKGIASLEGIEYFTELTHL